MRTSRFQCRTALLAAALTVASAGAFARQPAAPAAADLSGKYNLPGGGYLVVAVNDTGRVEGFFERDEFFGRVSGKVDAGVASATWVQDRGATACAETVDGSQYWGKVTLSRDAAGAVQTAWSECEASLSTVDGGR